MASLSSIDLENILKDLKNKKYKLIKELSDLDTEIIGIKISLDIVKENERILLDQERSKEHFSYRINEKKQ